MSTSVSNNSSTVASDPQKSLLQAQAVTKSYIDAGQSIDVLKKVNVNVYAGEMLAILGASGSGKSTLLHILGTLDSADSGEVTFESVSLGQLNTKQQAKFRNKELGFVYQFHHLLPEFSALENVAMPQLIAGVSKKLAHSHAKKLLDRVGLSHRLNNKPHQLSGGERQRVAIARALVNAPRIIMADEPTGNLDNQSSQEILALLKEINKQDGTSFIIVTHDHSLAKQLDRTLTLVNGSFVANASSAASS
jgi:lipoprotein-releasing system ATP-binding protein